MAMLHIRNLPTLRKPRERLIVEGAEVLSVAELVAIILGSGCKGSNIIELSEKVALELGRSSFSLQSLQTIHGLGLIKAVELIAALQLSITLKNQSKSEVLKNPLQIYEACSDFVNKPQEHLVVFYLSVHSESIARETITIGTATASLVHPREVFRPAILHNAAHIVVAHNHPSGNTTPSNADRMATRTLVNAGKQLGIEVLDHVICAKESYTSMVEIEPDLFN